MSFGMPPYQEYHFINHYMACPHQVVQDNKMVKWIPMSPFPLEWQPQANRWLCKDWPVLSKIKMLPTLSLSWQIYDFRSVNVVYLLRPPHLWHWQLGAKCKYTHHIFLAFSSACSFQNLLGWISLWQKFRLDMLPSSLVSFWQALEDIILLVSYKYQQKQAYLLGCCLFCNWYLLHIQNISFQI